MSELDRDKYIEEEKASAARQAVGQAINDVLLHLEEPLVISTNPRVTLYYDDESREQLPENLVSFINDLYQGREVVITKIDTNFFNFSEGSFHISIGVKPTKPMEGDSDSPGFLKGGIIFPDQQEVRLNNVRFLTYDARMLYMQGRHELGSWKEIQHYGESVSLTEDSDVDLKRSGMNPDEYQTFDMGRPEGGDINPEIIFAIADQYRNLIDARVITPKPRMDYSID